MQTKELCELALDSLDELKAVEVRCFDVTSLTDISDFMVVASGTSNRHVSSIVNHLLMRCKEQGIRILGVEGQDTCEWVLIDLVDVLVHVMLPATREFYDLERLWGTAKVVHQPDEQG